MKKIIVTLFLAAFLFVGNVAADSVGDGYEAGGVQFGGYASYYNSFNGYQSLSVNPYLNFFVANGVSVGINGNFNIEDWADYSFGFGGDLAYSLVMDPSAASGFVMDMGLSVGYRNGNTFSGYVYTYPYIRAKYHMTPTIAPYLYLTAVTLNFNPNVYVSTYLNIGIGVSFIMPTRDKTL